ncbi:DUF6457 domain-containing protein [Pengzhenrongella sp.]|jgi:hypothetical protein|uniref:DUF6457 domain-containing protein n=1 Tax=Pengzhenrongella sp. TaxID=2888820 RepID=UPI002F94BEA4
MIEMDRVNTVGEVPPHAQHAEHGLEDWVGFVSAALGIDQNVVDVAALLDVAREAADGVGRPAAPLTTFLVGYAAGKAAGDGEADPAISELIAIRVGELSREWSGRPAISPGTTSAAPSGTTSATSPGTLPASSPGAPTW